MNNKMIGKLFLDTVMTVLMIVLMGYHVTGNKMHEILGITLFVLFIIHCILNRKWFQNLKNITKNYKKNKVLLFWALTNILLIVDMILLLVSSVMISREVFSIMSIEYSYVWVYIHTVCAYGGLIIMSIHLGFHWKMIMNGIKKSFHIESKSMLRNILLKLITCFMVIAGVKSSYDRSIGGKFIPDTMKTDTKTIASSQAVTKSETKDDIKPLHDTFDDEKRPFKKGKKHGEKISETKIADEPIEDGTTLDDYLGTLICTGCGRRCSLLAPKCSIGVQQAQDATLTYQAQVNETSSEDTKSIDENNITNTLEIAYEDDSLLELFMDFVPIMGLYVAGTYYTLQVTNRNNRRKKEKKQQ